MLARFAPLASVPKRLPSTTIASCARTGDLNARRRLKPKTLAAPVEVPPIVLPLREDLYPVNVAQVGAAGIGAEEIADNHVVRVRGV